MPMDTCTPVSPSLFVCGTKLENQGTDRALDIKPSNILVHVGPEDQEITEVQVADFGSTMSEENKYAKEGEEIGTAVFNSPELFLSMPWSTPIDIWAFGATVRSSSNNIRATS
jgi:serine/threonine protein kinase